MRRAKETNYVRRRARPEKLSLTGAPLLITVTPTETEIETGTETETEEEMMGGEEKIATTTTADRTRDAMTAEEIREKDTGARTRDERKRDAMN